MQVAEMCAVTTDLAQTLEAGIRQRTGRHIRGLRVEVHEGQVAVLGTAPSYYEKQLAIQACLEQLATLAPICLAVKINVAAPADQRSRA
jgi:hypothetical protein